MEAPATAQVESHRRSPQHPLGARRELRRGHFGELPDTQQRRIGGQDLDVGNHGVRPLHTLDRQDEGAGRDRRRVQVDLSHLDRSGGKHHGLDRDHAVDPDTQLARAVGAEPKPCSVGCGRAESDVRERDTLAERDGPQRLVSGRQALEAPVGAQGEVRLRVGRAGVVIGHAKPLGGMGARRGGGQGRQNRGYRRR